VEMGGKEAGGWEDVKMGERVGVRRVRGAQSRWREVWAEVASEE
jgi:hypothetical protein